MTLIKSLDKMPYAVLMILFAAISITTFGSNFLFIDDTILIVNNPQLHFSLSNLISIFIKPLGQIFDAADYPIKFIYYRPALNLLYMFNNIIWGLNPVGFHISNLLLHLFTTLILYRCGLLLFQGNRSVSLLAAGLFCVHPVHNELIARVAMNENLLGFFMVASFYFYLKQRNRLSLIFFVLALMSKESAVMLPAVIFFFELSKKRIKEAARFLYPFMFVVVLYFLVRLIVLGLPVEVKFSGNLMAQFLVSFSALAAYLKLLVVPFPLSVCYPLWKFVSPFQPDFIVSVAICIIATYLLWRFRDDKVITPLFIGTIILLAPVVFKANELILGSDRWFIAERQLYVPSLFFSLFVGSFLFRYSSSYKVRYGFVLLVAVVILFAVLNVSFSAVWTSGESLTANIIKTHPNTIISHRFTGVDLLNEGKFDEAMSEFTIALNFRKVAAGKNNISPPVDSYKFQNFANMYEKYDLAAYQSEYADIHYHMGKVYLAQNNVDAAMKKFSVVLVLQPHFYNARTALADIYMKKKMYREASREYKLALKDIEVYRPK